MKKIKVTKLTKDLVDADITAVSVAVGWLSFGYLYALLSSKINRRYLKKSNDLMSGYSCGIGVMACAYSYMDYMDAVEDAAVKFVAKITDKIFEVVDEEETE